MPNEKLYPWYFQEDEDSVPEFLGFAKNWDGAIDLMDSSRVHGMSVIDTVDEDMIDCLEFNDDEDYDALVKYFKEGGDK